MHIKDKIVIITGASQGLGKELSLKLGKLGCKVALVSRTEKLLKDLKKHIISNGGTAEYFVCDVSVWEDVKKTVKKIIKIFGTVDILVNGAGIWTTEELEEKNMDLVESAFKVNSIGPIYFSKAVLPVLKKNNSGHIFNVISNAGLDIPEIGEWLTYSATKWAMTGYTKGLKYALKNTKIKVTAFYPAGFESNIFETAGEGNVHNQPWMMKTSEVADAIIYALDTPKDLSVGSIAISKVE